MAVTTFLTGGQPVERYSLDRNPKTLARNSLVLPTPTGVANKPVSA